VTLELSLCDAYARAARLADAGRVDEAIAVLTEHLREQPEDGQALNDAGALLYSAGRYDESIDFLKRAVACLSGNPGQPLWNLAEVYLAAGRPAEVVPLFDGLAGAGVMTADLANRTATALLNRGDTARGIEALIASFRISPQQDMILPVYERVRSLRPKVAFFVETCDTKFIGGIYAYINARFESRFCQGQSDAEMFRVMQWCDIAWMEWCTNQVVVASQRPKLCRTVVRLHRYEAFSPWPERVQWEHIDALVTVGNSAVHKRLLEKIPDIERRTRVVAIPNGVDLERFSFVNRPRGKNLAFVGRIHMVKNPMLLLHAFQRLHAIDSEYRLFFAGEYQDDGVLQSYMQNAVEEMGLGDAVVFNGWQEDVAGWLEDKHYLVSSSIVEGHPVGVIEGMARGLKPVVHTFPGCHDFFPPEYLWRTVDEFCERILLDSYCPEAYRNYVATHFSLKRQLEQINGLFLDFERDPVTKPSADELAAATADEEAWLTQAEA